MVNSGKLQPNGKQTSGEALAGYGSINDPRLIAYFTQALLTIHHLPAVPLCENQGCG